LPAADNQGRKKGAKAAGNVSCGNKGRSGTAYLYPIAETKQDQRLERYVQGLLDGNFVPRAEALG